MPANVKLNTGSLARTRGLPEICMVQLYMSFLLALASSRPCRYNDKAAVQNIALYKANTCLFLGATVGPS